MKKIIFWLLQVVLLVIFVIGFYIFNDMQMKPTTVFVFTRELQANSVITAQDITQVNIPATAVVDNFALNPYDFINKKIVNTTVYPGQYVINPQLADISEKDPFLDMDLSGYVKAIVPIGLTDAALGMIEPGDKVDLVYMGSTTSIEGSATYATRFMNDVLVYKVLDGALNDYENYLEQPIQYDSEGNVIESPTDLTYLVLAVTPEQSLELMTRQRVGSINVMVRFEETETTPLQDFIWGPPGEVTLGFGDVEQQ